MRFGKRNSSPFVISLGVGTLNSVCAAVTRLLKEASARPTAPALAGAAKGPCEAGAADRGAASADTAKGAEAAAAAATVTAAALVTWPRNARRVELFRSTCPEISCDC